MLKIRIAVKEFLQKYELIYRCRSCPVRSYLVVKYELFQFDIEQLNVTHYILVFLKRGSKTSVLSQSILC